MGYEIMYNFDRLYEGYKKCRREELLLKFNEETQLTAMKDGVDYLGFRFYLTDTGKVIRRLRTKSKRRWKRRLKKMKWQYREDEISLEEITRSIASYKGFPYDCRMA